MSSKKNNLKPYVAVGALSSPMEVGADKAASAAEETANLLEKYGYQVERLGSIDNSVQSVQSGLKIAEKHVQSLVLVVSSWFEDYLVLDLLEECRVPLLLWSLPGMETGALCGTQQLTAYLKQLDILYSCIFGNLDCEQTQAKAKSFIVAAALKHKLRRAQIGLGGYRLGGMTEVSANEFAIKKTIGPRIVNLNMPDLMSRVNEITDQDAEQLWQDILNRSEKCNVSNSQGLYSIKMYLVLKNIADELQLDALAIGCVPELMGKVCLASSLLADEGIPLACEGDVNGAIGQLILTSLSGQPTHNTDWLEPLEDGSVVFTHCGSGSFSLAENQENIELSPARLTHQGVCVLFPSKPGPVTLLSLISDGLGFQIAILEGEAISTEMVFPGNPLRVKFDKPIGDIINWIHEEGIGHHWMAGYGSYTEEVVNWVKLCGASLRLLQPGS